MGDFVSKYAKRRPTKDRGHDPSKIFVFNRQQENNDIVNYAWDEIILQENDKVSDESEAHETIESDIDENNLYKIENMSIDYKKEKH